MKKEYTRMPLHSEIYDYWKTKLITKDYEIADFVDNRSAEGHIVIKDWGEPECWCCGNFVQKVYKHSTYNNDLQSEEGIKKIWNYKEVQSTLNRCHIHPKALGGSFHPSNLFLLCEECHQLSPDTTNPKIFFSWILKHREVAMRDLNGWNEKEKNDAIQELDNMCNNFSINKIEFMKYIHNNKKELDTFLSSNVNTHGNEIVLSSLIGGMIDFYMKSEKEVAI